MIAGVATETIVVSTRIMKKPRHSANSAGHGLLLARRPAVGAGRHAWVMVHSQHREPWTMLAHDLTST